MSTLSKNLQARRDQLDLTVPAIAKEMQRMGHVVAESTVYAWFNGGRKPRTMEQLRALCEILQTTISEMAGEDPDFAQNAFESTLLSESRELDTGQREAILALMRAMRPKQ
jgi:transcriptional regulator with XRE-family HTH domain